MKGANSCDLAVIGAGPAGLAAATMAAGLGLTVTVFDEQATPGGQIYRNIEAVHRQRSGDLPLLGEDYQQGLALVEDFRASPAEYRPNCLVWDLATDGSGSFCISENGQAHQLQAEHLLLACGAMERPVPIPGWTLPGVMGAGAAQTLLKSAALIPDKPVVLAGSGPLLYLVAWQLLQAGAAVQALLSTSSRYLAALPELPRALRAADQLWKGFKWRQAIRRAGVPALEVGRLRAEGAARLEGVSYQAVNAPRPNRLTAELLLLHEGVVPNCQLSMLAGCEHVWDGLQHAWRPRLDAWGGSSVAKVSVAGDGGGIDGAQAAAHAGRIAAIQIAHRLGRISVKQRNRLAYPERARLKQQRRIRPFLDRLFEPDQAQRIPADDATLVCRCEAVSAAELRQAVRLGCTGPNQAKAFTRCGMGPCQGRLCSLTVSELIAAERGLPVQQVGHYRVRPPLKPLTVEALADMQGLLRTP